MNVQQLIASDEGRRNAAYLDSRGILTIGIGHTGPDVTAGLVWTDAQIDAQFRADVIHAHDGLAAALPWLPNLDVVRTAYLIGMAFQLGVRGVLGFPRMLGDLRDERWDNAAAEVRDSLWHQQTTARAERCARAFETGQWQTTT